MSEKSLYQVLQVDPAADQEVIAAAYRVLSGRLHPEQDITGVAEYRMAELNRAFAILGNPTDRLAYDAQLAAASPADALLPMGPGQADAGLDGGAGAGIAESASPFGSTLSDRIRARTADPNDLAQIRLDFGRYTGWTLGDLVHEDPDYLRWLSRHSSGIRYRGAVLRLLGAVEGQHRTPLNTRG